MKRISFITFILCTAVLVGAEAKYVFLMVGRNYGEATRQLLLKQYPEAALGKLGAPIPTGTLNAEGQASDDAAYGTAIACGVKTRNGRVGLEAHDRPVMSLAKVLQSNGFKIGIISSGDINGAIPGAQAANRMAGEIGIASDLYTNHIDFLGISSIKVDDEDTFNHFCRQGLSRAGYAVSMDGTLEGLQIGLNTKNPKAIPFEKARKQPIAVLSPAALSKEQQPAPVPSLSDFTAMAIQALDNSKGFYIMMEGMTSQANDASKIIHEAHEFDLAVAEAMKFQAEHPAETLIIVTAAHENSGSSAKVSTWVKGAGAERFAAPLENSDIPHRISVAMLGNDQELTSGLTPLPRAPNAVDYLSPRTAFPNSLMFQFGTIGIAPQKLELKDASGKVIKSVPCKDICGHETFNGLAPDTEYTLEMTKADGSVQTATGRTLPQPKGRKLFSFIVLSDMHFSCFGDIPFGRLVASSKNVLSNLVSYANDNAIPVIIEPGDCADASRDKEYAEIMKIMKNYKGIHLMTPGNHDRMGDGYKSFFGSKEAGIQEINGIQFVWLATGGPKTGFLGGKPHNAEVMKQYDPNRPAVIFTHYQLTKDTVLTDPDRVIHDEDKSSKPEVQAMLDKIASAKSTVIYIGHKNIATETKLGNSWQINCPQPTQFPCGYLLVDVYEDGLLQHYMPSCEARLDETSRRLGGGSEKHWKARDGRSFPIWNRFIPMQIVTR